MRDRSVSTPLAATPTRSSTQRFACATTGRGKSSKPKIVNEGERRHGATSGSARKRSSSARTRRGSASRIVGRRSRARRTSSSAISAEITCGPSPARAQLAPEGVEDARAAPELKTAARAAMVRHHQRQPVGQRRMGEVHRPAGAVVEIVDDVQRRRDRHEEQARAAQRGEPGQRRVPGLGADEGGERPGAIPGKADALALGVMPALGEAAVGRQVELAMDVQHAALRDQGLAVVEAPGTAVLDEAERDEHAACRVGQRLELWCMLRSGETRQIGLGEIIRERQLGEDEEVDATGPRLPDRLEMQDEVRRDVARPAFDLRRADDEAGHGPLVIPGRREASSPNPINAWRHRRSRAGSFARHRQRAAVMGSGLGLAACPGMTARHTSPCPFRNPPATSSTLFLSTSTEALSFAMVASSSFADSAFRASASFGFLSRTSFRTTGVMA